MKFVILNRSNFEKIGGVETTLYSISKELSALGHEVSVLSGKSGDNEISVNVKHRIKFVSYPYPSIPKVLLPLAPFVIKKRIGKTILNVVSNEKPDIIITRDSIMTMIANENKGKSKVIYIPPVIIKFYNSKLRKAQTTKDFIISILRYLQLTIENSYQKISIKKSDKIIVFSNNMKQQIEKAFGNKIKNEIFVIHPGVNKKFSFERTQRYEIHKEFNISFSKKILLFVGRIVQEKNLHMLIRAFNNINSDDVLIIVGDGDALKSLKKLTEDLGITERVYFTGARRDVEVFFKSATFSVVPSTYEAFGNVISESLSCGTPVIGFKNNPPLVRNAVNELVRDNYTGFIVNDFSEKTLALTIEKALQFSHTDKYVTMRENCSTFADSTFNWNKFVKKML